MLHLINLCCRSRWFAWAVCLDSKVQRSCCAKGVSFSYCRSVTRHAPGEQSIPVRCLYGWQQSGRIDVEDCLLWVTVQTPLGPSFLQSPCVYSLSSCLRRRVTHPNCLDRLESHNLCGCSANRATNVKGDTATVSYRELTGVLFIQGSKAVCRAVCFV